MMPLVLVVLSSISLFLTTLRFRLAARRRPLKQVA
jgi:hypothetical protein